jgi:hypothetical protein
VCTRRYELLSLLLEGPLVGGEGVRVGIDGVEINDGNCRLVFGTISPGRHMLYISVASGRSERRELRESREWS